MARPVGQAEVDALVVDSDGRDADRRHVVMSWHVRSHRSIKTSAWRDTMNLMRASSRAVYPHAVARPTVGANQNFASPMDPPRTWMCAAVGVGLTLDGPFRAG